MWKQRNLRCKKQKIILKIIKYKYNKTPEFDTNLIPFQIEKKKHYLTCIKHNIMSDECDEIKQKKADKTNLQI